MDQYERQAIELFYKVMKTEGLSISLSNPNIKRIEGGGILIEQANLIIQFTPEKLKELQISEKGETDDK